jgi:thioredoxin reductase
MARAKVAIVGGGPSGLILAIELGRRGVPCVLLEEDATPPTLPKANATTSRTMEHYRRLGFAAEIRALGLPEDYPQDIAYFTRYTAYELARLPGAAGARRSRRGRARIRAGRRPSPCTASSRCTSRRS